MRHEGRGRGGRTCGVGLWRAARSVWANRTTARDAPPAPRHLSPLPRAALLSPRTRRCTPRHTPPPLPPRSPALAHAPNAGPVPQHRHRHRQRQRRHHRPLWHRKQTCWQQTTTRRACLTALYAHPCLAPRPQPSHGCAASYPPWHSNLHVHALPFRAPAFLWGRRRWRRCSKTSAGRRRIERSRAAVWRSVARCRVLWFECRCSHRDASHCKAPTHARQHGQTHRQEHTQTNRQTHRHS